MVGMEHTFCDTFWLHAISDSVYTAVLEIGEINNAIINDRSCASVLMNSSANIPVTSHDVVTGDSVHNGTGSRTRASLDVIDCVRQWIYQNTID